MFDVFYIHNPPTGKLAALAKQVKTIEEARKESRTRFCWVVDGFNDYTDFDFTWEPSPWEAQQDHVWPSQHQENGGTTLVTKNHNGDTNYSHQVVQRVGVYPVVYMDMGNNESAVQYETLRKRYSASKTRFVGEYLPTIRRIIKNTNAPFVWIISSICDYETWDFTWHPSEWQQKMIHVFATGNQQFGDTFLISTADFKENPAELLEWYKPGCVWYADPAVSRFTPPIIMHQEDSLVDAIKKTPTFPGPYALYTTEAFIEISTRIGGFPIQDFPVPALWRENQRNIVRITPSGASALVPREAPAQIKKQVYDYPYIAEDPPTEIEGALDIVFLSNGETNAVENFQYLIENMPFANNIHLVANINGRDAAYKECARVANTPWFFIVWGKLKVNPRFNWAWQPDRFQAPKHYVFHAINPVNHLIYGHMGLAAYNKKLTLSNDNPGLDFIMSQPHEIVPLTSGIACFDNDPWMTWRTAFREAIKLKQFKEEGTDPAAAMRLDTWLRIGDGPYGKFSTQGANDAVRYYEEVNGDPTLLKLSYEWSWLRERYDSQY